MPYAALVLLEVFTICQFYRESKDFQPLFFLGCPQECQGYRPAGLDLHTPGFSFGCRGCIMQMWELPGRARPSEIVVFNEHCTFKHRVAYANSLSKSDERDYHDP